MNLQRNGGQNRHQFLQIFSAPYSEDLGPFVNIGDLYLR